MTPSSGRHSRRLGPFTLNPALLWLAALMLLAACSGGGGGCGGGCGGCGGFTQQPFPSEHNDKTVERSGQIRLTDTGLAFIEKEIPNILQQFLPNGLSFCLPKTEQSGATVCGSKTCMSSGQTGCQLNMSLDNATIRPSPPDTLLIDVTIGMLNEVIPFEYQGIDCKADLHKDGEDQSVAASIDATIPITFTVDQQSPTKDVAIEVGELEADLSRLGIDIDGNGNFGDTLVCEGADGIVKPLARGVLEDRMKDEVNKAVQDAVRENLCRPCGDMQPACPSGASCKDFDGAKLCDYDNQDKCVPRKLGVEGRLVLASALGDFMEPEEANVDLMLKAADLAEVDGGVNIGMRAGFHQDQIRDCAPVDPTARPSLDPIPKTNEILSNQQPGTGDPFMIGLGFHKNAIKQMLWTTWASGATCMKIGSDFNSLLNTESFGLLVPSSDKLTDRKAPVFLKVAPQTAPTVELGPNNITESDGSYELDKPLATIKWKDLDLHFYAFVQDRYTRLFTLRTDIEIPFGLTSDGMGKLVPVTGDLEQAATNVRVRNNGILADEKSKLKELIPTLLGAALPQLTGSLSDPIDLPSFFGYKIVVNQDDITSVDSNQFIALYANLKRVPMGQPLSADIEPKIRDLTVDTSGRADSGLPRPEIVVDMTTASGTHLASRPIEYSYRVDNGFWSMFQAGEELVVDDPVLALQGEHTVQIRARYPESPATATAPVETTVAVDFSAPSVSLDRDGRQVDIVAEDAVDDASEMSYRWRLEDADGETLKEWSSWGDNTTVSLADQPAGSVRLVAQARDAAGHIGEAADEMTLAKRAVSVDQFGDQQETTPHTPRSSGCSTAGGSGQPPIGGLLMAALAGLGLLVRRRRRLVGMVALAAVALLGLTACNNDIQKGNTCSPECAAWETCKDGSCESTKCNDPSDCPDDATCIDGSCQMAECSEDADCSSCGADKQGTCMMGQCTCKDFCPDGCGEGKFCCYEANGCQSYPDPCMDHEACDPGYKKEVADQGTADPKTCEVSGGSCECVEKDPLPLYWYGQYASIDTEGEVTAVSGYNRTYGDLMVGVLDENMEPNWYYPAGVPTDADVVAAPSGPRGGIEEHGDDVGSHTAIAVDGDGNLHVFYRSEENDSLNYARGTKGSEGYSFETVELDDDGDSGLYTSATLKEGNVHAVYSATDIEVDIDGETLDGSEIRHISFPTDTAPGMISATPEVVHTAGPDNPCGACGSGESCFEAAEICAAPSSDCGMDGCGEGLACRDGSCESTYKEPETPAHRLMTGLYTEVIPTGDGLTVFFYDHNRQQAGWTSSGSMGWQEPTFVGSQSGPYISGAVDSNGELHLAYMDPTDKTLVYQPPGNAAPETIDDGTRDANGEYLVSAIGQDVDLWIDSSGNPQVTYQDATRHILLSAERDAMGSWTVTPLAKPGGLDAFKGSRGFYSSNVAPEAGIAVEYVIDQQADPVGARLEVTEIE